MKAIVTGVNGQDGSYLAELLLSQGYKVIGTVRSKNPSWPDGFDPNQTGLEIRYMDLGYPDSIRWLINESGMVSECYNLAAQSHVGISFDRPQETYNVTGLGACQLMDEFFNSFPHGKFYQASTSEMFGNRKYSGRYTVGDPFEPASPYAVAKTMAHYNVVRHQKFGNFCVSGILFNHESERRHASFVTQKICKSAVKIYRFYQNGCQGEFPMLVLGNTDAVRDWGYAPQYVRTMTAMLRQDRPGTYVIGTGQSYSVLQFAQMAFDYLGIGHLLKGHLEHSMGLIRPNDVQYLEADPSDANKLLSEPLIPIAKLIAIMIDHQMRMEDEK